MLYFILCIILLDLTRLLNHFFSIYPQTVSGNYEKWKLGAFIASLLITTIVVIAGYINTRIINIKNLDVKLAKKNSSLNELNIVTFADIHLTAMNDEKFLRDVVEKTNRLNPDIVLIPGDFVDEKKDWLAERGIGKAFFDLKPKYGTYACTGNHEFIVDVNDVSEFIRSHNITLLRDEMIMIDSAFYLAGRDDRMFKKRKSLDEIVADRNENYPLILMDHTPFGLEDAEKNNVDLQLSGHTHHGQMWPLNYITQKLYEQDWGYLKKGSTQYYVTCGVGTWGPPVRTGSKTEIVNIKVRFE